jgi:hypothetical protein
LVGLHARAPTPRGLTASLPGGRPDARGTRFRRWGKPPGSGEGHSVDSPDLCDHIPRARDARGGHRVSRTLEKTGRGSRSGRTHRQCCSWLARGGAPGR